MLEQAFPNLRQDRWKEKSPRDHRYNCIAWAAGESHRKWWPFPLTWYWPPGVDREEKEDTFIEAFATLGYQPCGDDRTLEPGFEKVALCVRPLDRAPQHMSRQLSNGEWTSKMGHRGVDIIHHTLDALVGAMYGQVTVILKRSY